MKKSIFYILLVCIEGHTNGFEFLTSRDKLGNFMYNLKGVRLGAITTIRAYHEDYKSNSIIRHI